MRSLVLLAAVLAIATLARAQCSLTRFPFWESNFDLTPLQIPTVVLDTLISFDANGAGTFESVTSYRGQCFVAVNGTYTYTEPFLDFAALVSEPSPNPTSVSCQLLGVASLAIGTDSFLPSSNITFSADCNTFNMTFLDNVGLPQTRVFQKGSALVLFPSLLLVAMLAILQFF